jgi:hypothetical protein
VTDPAQGRRPGHLWLVLALVAAAALVACNADEGNGDGGGDAESPPVKAEFTEFCIRALQTETYPEPGVDLSQLSPPEQTFVVKAYAAGLVAQAERVREVAPEQIRSDVNVLVDAMVAVQNTGDFKPLEDERVLAATGRVHRFELDNCGWGREDITAVEYAYRGVTSSVRGGPRSFELKNEGKEPHELVVFRIKDGIGDSLQRLLELPRDQFGALVTNMGSASAQPGKESFVVADLTPGRYALVCFIPIGGGSEGPPHFTEGMQAEFRVA